MKNQSVIENLRKIMIVFLVILVCLSNVTYATEVIATAGSDNGGETEDVKARDPNLPYMEMYVRSKKIGENNRQIIVEWWAYKVTDMQAFDIRFTYNSKYLQPSYIEADIENEIEKNAVLQDIESIKYDKRAEAIDEDEFDDIAKETLMGSFSFNSKCGELGDIGDILEVQKLRYLPSQTKEIEKTKIDENTGEETTVTESIEYEKLQFVVSKKFVLEEETTNTNEENTNTGNTNIEETNEENTNSEETNTEETKRREITATDPEKPIHIGTFSFKVKDEGDQLTIVEEGSFETTKVTITCNDKEDEDYTTYERDEEYENSEEDGEDIAKFVYAKYGSISGKVEELCYFAAEDRYELLSNKPKVEIILYDAEDENIAKIDWTDKGTNYFENRMKLQPILDGEYYDIARPNKNGIPEIEPVKQIISEDEIFKIDNVLFGKYVLLVNKLDCSDYIMTNIVIDSNNRDIDIGTAQIEIGDFNKDGEMTVNDATIFERLYYKFEYLKQIGIDVYEFTDLGYDFDSGWAIRTLSSLDLGMENRKIKQVVDYQDNN